MSADWAGLLGVAFAAVLASVGYTYQVRVGHKRSARRVLYLLLEIRSSFLAAVFDPKKATQKYVEHFVSRSEAQGLETQGIQFPQPMLDLITSHFGKSIEVVRSDLESRLLRDYEEALLDLASVHPTLAYRLLGRNKLEKLVGVTKEYMGNCNGRLDSEVQDVLASDLLIAVFSKAQHQAFGEITSILDKDVLDLARTCGYLDYRRCKRIVKQTAMQMSESLAEIDPMIDQFLRMAVEFATRKKSDARTPSAYSVPN